MISFDQFTKKLGDDATNYSDNERRQLYVEVHQLADILLVVHRSGKKPMQRTVPLSTPSPVDGRVPDRTVKAVKTHVQ